MNPHLHIPKTLRVDDYFERIHASVREQFRRKTPTIRVEEMLALPALEKMFCPVSASIGQKSRDLQQRRNETIIAAGKEETKMSMGKITRLKTRIKQGENADLAKMLNFASLYIEPAADSTEVATKLDYASHDSAGNSE